MNIGDRIKKLRERKGISQQQLADILRVGRETVARWENGTRDLKTAAIIDLAKYFNVTSDYLLGLSNSATVERVIGISELTLKTFELNKNDYDEDYIPKIIEVMNEFIQDTSFVDVCSKIAECREKYKADKLQDLMLKYIDELTDTLKYNNEKYPDFNQWIQDKDINIDVDKKIIAFINEFATNIETYEYLTNGDVRIYRSYPQNEYMIEDSIKKLQYLVYRLCDKYISNI